MVRALFAVARYLGCIYLLIYVIKDLHKTT
jgi:hypothetical protein